MLPIGGLREKLLAAVRANITDVILPEDNRKDVEEVPADIVSKLKIRYVRSADEVLRFALTRYPASDRAAKSASPVSIPDMNSPGRVHAGA